MFTNTFLNNEPPVLPMAAGAAITGGLVGAILLFPLLVLQHLDMRLPAPLVYVNIVKPPKHIAPAQAARRAVSAEDRTAEPAPRDAAKPVSPGTPAWEARVESGSRLGFDIYAVNSLPVLRDFKVTVALDCMQPRGGDTYLYELGTGTYTHGPLPSGVIVRELVDLPPTAGLDAAIARTEQELGRKVRIWALYSPELFSVLRSLCEDVLRQAAVPLETVSSARVVVHLVGPRTFTVTLVSHS